MMAWESPPFNIGNQQVILAFTSGPTVGPVEFQPPWVSWDRLKKLWSFLRILT